MPRRAVRSALLVAGALGAAAPHAGAAYGPPWVSPDVALVDGVRSARVRLGDQHMFAEPSATAAKRGTAAKDALLPVFGARRGSGCRNAWISVGPSAWVCDDAVELSTARPIDASIRPRTPAQDGLPFRYFFVGPDGSFAYKRLEAAEVSDPDMQLQPGFAVAIAEERAFNGGRYGRTQHDLWLPMRDIGAVHPFLFQGAEIGAGGLDVAWSIADKARVFSKPTKASPTDRTLARFEQVKVLRESTSPLGTFYAIGENAWIAARDARRPTPSEPPAEVDADGGERWIDVDIATQTLVAYEGRKPVFATLVSTGKGRPGSPLATPVGAHRVWIKLISSDMDNLEDENASRYYRMENVPWVQYFDKGVGLHGAFWHRSFGQVRSHGCVNVSPLDAERLFWFTGPHLPAGWTAVFPTAHEPGTLIRVR